jgi:hypothetical protein
VKQHAEAIDAMFDGKFDDYVHRKFVIPEIERQQIRQPIEKIAPEPYRFIAPVLEKHKKVKEQEKEKTFADNITKSFIIQGIGITAVEMDKIRRKGQTVTNADEIGAAVAKNLTSLVDPYRR